jgi:hypothetical protein
MARVFAICLVLLAVGAWAESSTESTVHGAEVGHRSVVDDLNLDEIDSIDDSVFKSEGEAIDDAKPSAPAAPPAPTPTAAAPQFHEAAEVDAASSDASSDSADAATAKLEPSFMSFRTMNEAMAAAGSTVSEKAETTHRIAQRFLGENAPVRSAEDIFEEINREQQILMAKRALVMSQRQAIVDSEKSLKNLKELVDDNRSILARNEQALRRASDDLLGLISKYQSQLRSGFASPAPINANAKPKPKPTPVKAAKPAAAKQATKKAAGKKKATKKKATKKKATKKMAVKKASFAQVHTESDDEDESKDADTEEADEEEEDAEEDEQEDEADAEAEAEAETDEEADADVDTESSLLESGAFALPGLSPPPRLYNAEEDAAANILA